MSLKEAIPPPTAAFVIREDDNEYSISIQDASKLYQTARNMQLGTLAEAVSREKQLEQIRGGTRNICSQKKECLEVNMRNEDEKKKETEK